MGGQSVLQNVNVYKNEGESHRRSTPTTHAAYFWTIFFFPLLRLPLFWRVHGRSNRCPLLLSSAAIGMATLAEPHSYSLPILVTGLARQATARSPPTLDTFWPLPRLLFFFLFNRALKLRDLGP